MDRYRAIGQAEDPSLNEGDGSFVGVDQYSAIENIEPGLVQDAVNCDFSSQDGVTRGGFVCLPELGSTPFQSTSDWTIRTSAQDNQWKSVAYGNRRFVAVSTTGASRVMTSTDGGITWVSRTAAAADEWWGVAYGAGLFAAVSEQGTVMTSPDGVTWTSRTIPGTFTGGRGITYGNGLFVAVGGGGTTRVITSPDGITWTGRTAASADSWWAVTYGSGLYVAVANSTAAIMTSPDGTTWTSRTPPSGSGYTGVAFGNSTYVAVGLFTPSVISSSDGITWTTRTAPEANNWNGVCFGSSLFIAVAGSGTNRIMTSPDGITWTGVAAPAANMWTSVAGGLGTFVGVAESGTGNRAMTAGETASALASGPYSDPNDAGSQWAMIAGQTKVGFYAFGRTSRTVNYQSGETVTVQSTIVQANNKVYIFRGSDKTPLVWDGNWSGTFIPVATPTLSAGFSAIPNSSHATFYQNRLWPINGKDTVSASDVLEFDQYDNIANSFNLNTGSSDYLVTTYPFGTNTLLVFKNRSILALENVGGSLSDVTVTEITRQVGVIGINAVVSVGPDVVYMSDRNINLISLTSTNNALQHRTLPLSTKIKKIIERVNWQYAYKVSMAYYDNKLYVALPLDNSTTCNAVAVYNFVTEQWFGEWSFDSTLDMNIQGWIVQNYLGVQRLHCITEDGRIFVVGEGQNDISGTTVAEISMSVTTRAYTMDNSNRINRRLYLDLATNRPNFSVVAYSEGASESSAVLSGQTFSRSQSWKFNDSTYDLTNANNDYNRAYRKDYSTGPDSIQCGASGILPEMEQEYRLPLITRRQGRLAWLKLTNTTGLIRLMTAGFEARAGMRNNLYQT